MGFPATAVFEVRTTGSDGNGGGFNAARGGTDYTLQDTAQATGTVTSTLTDVVATTGIFTSGMVGNYITDGTIWREILAVNSATDITVDSAPSWTTTTIKVGGALASIGGAGKTVPLGGNVIFIKAGTYSISSATPNVAGGTYNTSSQTLVVGYSTNRTLANTDTPPVLQYTVSSVTVFSDRGHKYNLTLDGNSQTTSTPFANNGSFDLCTFKNFNTASSNASCARCLATANSAAIFTGYAFGCEAYANTATPFNGLYFAHCLAYGNTGGSTDGFLILDTTSGMSNNLHAYGNGRDGVRLNANARGGVIVNCHAENNAGFGINLNGNSGISLVNCSTYNNTSGAVSAPASGTSSIGQITPTGSVYVAAGSNNFELNNTTNQGALLRGAGFPGLFLRGITQGFLDIGSSQHQDAGGSAGMLFIPNGEGS